ncbi:MAG: anti-sigma factor family protein, partial [Gemmatimonadota bacterium]
MDCREFLTRYSDYDDSLVPPTEAERFRAHMAGCEACARYDRVLRKGRMLARQLPGPEPATDFGPRLLRRLLECRHGVRSRRRLAAVPVPAAAAVLGLVLAATAAVG